MATSPSNTTLRKFITDLSERTVFTFLATLVALYTPVLLSVSTGANWHVLLSLSFAQKAVVAGLASAVTVVKGALATSVGDTSSPGLLPTWLLQLMKANNSSPVILPALQPAPFVQTVSSEFKDELKNPQQ